MSKLSALLLCLLFLPLGGIAGTSIPYPGALYPVRVGGLWGYMDYTGSIRIQPQWVSTGQFRNGAAVVAIETGDGIIDTTGRYIVEPVYGIDEGYGGSYYGGRETGVILVRKEASLIYNSKETENAVWLAGFYDVQSGFFAEPIWHEVYPMTDGSRLIPVASAQDDVKWWRRIGYADRTTGMMVIPYQYGNAEAAQFYEGFALVEAIPDDNYEEVEAYFINESGERLILPDGIIPLYKTRFSEGLALVQDAETYLFGYIDSSGSVVIRPQFDEANDFNEGFAAVYINGLWGFIDRTGAITVEPRYAANAYSNGLAFVALDNRLLAIDTKGRLAFMMDEGAVSLGPFMDNGLAPFSWFGLDSWGLVNREGHVVLDPAEGYRLEETYYLGSAQEMFSEGLQTLSKDGLCGFINEQGQEATPFEWDYCENFHNGLAYVEKDGKMAYIDHAGAVVWAE
jgi:hypothetical protein